MDQVCLHSINDLNELIEEKGWSCILLVIGNHTKNETVFSDLILMLATKNLIVITTPSGLLDLNDTHSHKHSLNKIEVIIALGGGKTIDFAKGLIYSNYSAVDFLYFIAIPTTAGSGSEATHFAVYYEGCQKISIQRNNLLPTAVLHHSIFLKHLSSKQRATSAFDAIAQCIESIWSRNATNDSIKLAMEGLNISWKNLTQHVIQIDNDIDDLMLKAAYMSGKAIAITRTTGPHALSYFLTANYNIPHGQAVGLLLPIFFLYNEIMIKKIEVKSIYEVLNNRMQVLFEILNAKDQIECAQLIQEKMQTVGLAFNFKDHGIDILKTVDDLLLNYNQERFSNHPVPFEYHTLRQLFLQNG
jgi:alcohol dehydrogenase class IV